MKTREEQAEEHIKKKNGVRDGARQIVYTRQDFLAGYDAGRLAGIEEAAQRCEREAKAFGGMRWLNYSNVCKSCATWIRALSKSEKQEDEK